MRGVVPPWLTGSLLRTGPAQWDTDQKTLRHWFDGFAMLHSFGIENGNVSYANRMLESESYKYARDNGKIAFSEFATDPCRSLFKRVQSIFSPALGDNANVNLVKLGERHISMTETAIAVEFDAKTLETVGVAYEAPGMVTTAHPHLNRKDKGLLNYAAKLGARNEYRFYELAPDDLEPRVVARKAVKEPAYMHSFGLTENFIILAEFPFVVNPAAIALSGKPYIENFKWKPERGTKFTLFRRDDGTAAHKFTADACFAFHHVNAFELGGEVIVDICAFEDASLIDQLYMDRLRGGQPTTASPRLRRFILNTKTGKAISTQVSDASLELPRINYARYNERPYNYVWGAGIGESGWFDQINKIEIDEGESLTWQAAGCFPGEPVFVARPDATAEDDGVLLSVVFDAANETSFLLILDAATMIELARADVPHHIPFGFHGQFAKS